MMPIRPKTESAAPLRIIIVFPLHFVGYRVDGGDCGHCSGLMAMQYSLFKRLGIGTDMMCEASILICVKPSKDTFQYCNVWI
uniref:hypothetical protein n=1 Tax=Yoonia sp. TaxID=2212373 RepID=UPI0040472443